jgi:hypothetical protein
VTNWNLGTASYAMISNSVNLVTFETRRSTRPPLEEGVDPPVEREGARPCKSATSKRADHPENWVDQVTSGFHAH